MANSIKVCSANCQGLGSSNSEKRRDVLKYHKNKKFDIYFLQDTHFEPDIEVIVRAEWGYECWFNSFTSRARGVAILFNNTFEFKMKDVYSDKRGNLIVINVIINSIEYILVNVYAPNKDEPDFFRSMQNVLNKYNVDNVIIGGDWNLLLDPNIDGKNYKHVNNPRAKEEVSNLTLQFNLTDIWRHLHPSGKQYTWHKKVNRKIIQQGRLDFFLLSDQLVNLCQKSGIIPGYRTDHSIVTFELNAIENKRAKTFWKFNNLLLRDQTYIETIKNTINNTKIRYMPLVYIEETIGEVELFQPSIDAQLFLEVLLMEIRSSTLKYSAIRKKDEQNEEKQIILDIEELEKDKELNQEVILEKTEKLEAIRKNKLIGALIRSRANWIENGEKPTKYFCYLENRHFISKRMNRLVDKTGKEINEDEEIIEEAKVFYENLYSSKEHELCNMNIEEFDRLVHNKLSDDEAITLEGNISLTELSVCLKNMKNNKSPGSDGFSVEFFKFFWKDLKHFIHESIKRAFERNEMSNTQKEGIITCIPKGNKPREYLKNWRPICLLNVIYKMSSGCIANRIKNILPKIINEDQTGFIKNRFIGDNIRLTYDMIHHVNSNNKNGILLLIDFEKAFDTVAWKFIFDTLETFNFKSDIKRWISIFLNKMKSCIIVNNKVSGWFEIQRGCRQGDPLSPYIFVICAEILAIMIRNNVNIKGICIGSTEYKISQYADDTTLFLDGTKSSFEYCVHTILEYAKFSGLNMNFDKTKVVCLGNQIDSGTKYMPHLQFEWNPNTFTLLGTEFNVTLKGLMDLNLQNKMKHMINIMNSWSKRNLTPLGRITVIKSLVISKITHILMALPSTQSKLLVKLEKLFFKFIWKDKPDQMKRISAYQKIQHGGLNILNINAFQQALHITWIRRLMSSENAAWKSIIRTECKLITDIGKYGALYCNQCIRSTSNNFWKNVLEDYKKYCQKFTISNNSQFLSEPIFYNSRTNITANLAGCRRMQESNIYIIDQIFNRKEKRIYSIDEIENKYNIKIDFITMKHIEKGIKHHPGFSLVKQDLDLDEKFDNLTSYMKNILLDRKGTHRIYQQILPTSDLKLVQTKWSEDGFDNIDWHKAYMIIHRSLRCTRLKWMQIRITSRILTTNKRVSKFITNQSPLCSFCKNAEEDICHLFHDCNIVQEFWGKLTNEITLKCANMPVHNLPKEVILVGTTQNYYTSEVLDMLIVMAKLYIYRQKVKGGNLTLKHFIVEIKDRHDTEKYNAVLNNQIHKHLDKWHDIRPLIYDD